jgi:Arc/MetJ-type ribon-helix-helix transcriptional regulator
MADDDHELSDSISISIYPILPEQWEALRVVSSARGGNRSDLLREAIGRLLDDRDAGKPVIYKSSQKLSASEKMGMKPRVVWLKQPMGDRFKDRCADDRISQSEFVLEALRRYLKAEGIDIDPPL